jgi:hypothetical protein
MIGGGDDTSGGTVGAAGRADIAGGGARRAVDESAREVIEQDDAPRIAAARDAPEGGAHGGLGQVVGHSLPQHEGGHRRIEAALREAIEEVVLLEVARDVGRGILRIPGELRDARELLGLRGGLIDLEEAHAFVREPCRTRIETGAEHDHLRGRVIADPPQNMLIQPCGAHGDPQLALVQERVDLGGERLAFFAGEPCRPRIGDERPFAAARARSIRGDQQGSPTRMPFDHRDHPPAPRILAQPSCTQRRDIVDS